MTDINETLAQRGENYGEFMDNARAAQNFKSYIRKEHKATWDGMAYDQKEALDMIFHKIARILNGDPDYADSWIDIAGYATLVANRLK
jgi:hypothetical protein